MKETELLGQWWHPRTPDRRAGGVLAFDDEDVATLSAIGGVFRDGHAVGIPPELPTEPSGRAPILHGIADGRPVTLIDCISRRAILKGRSFTQYIRPGAVLIGLHLDSLDEKITSGLVVEIDNLTEWSDMRAMAPIFTENQDHAGFRFSLADSQSVTVGGTTVTLKLCRSGAFLPAVLSDGRRLDVREWVTAVFEFDTQRTWESG